MEWYTPRAYFYRDRLSQKLLFWEEGDPPRLSKSYVHGTMTDEELAEKTSSERYISFGTQPDSAYDDNFQALQELYDYCQTNGIRLRVVWMPTNPRVEPMPSGVAVQARLKQACEDLGVEYVDLSNMLPADCFYDTGHINQDGGSQQFTEVIDPWLNS